MKVTHKDQIVKHNAAAFPCPAIALGGPCPAQRYRQYLPYPALPEARQGKGVALGFTGMRRLLRLL
jgi:hypothetical protein